MVRFWPSRADNSPGNTGWLPGHIPSWAHCSWVCAAFAVAINFLLVYSLEAGHVSHETLPMFGAKTAKPRKQLNRCIARRSKHSWKASECCSDLVKLDPGAGAVHLLSASTSTEAQSGAREGVAVSPNKLPSFSRLESNGVVLNPGADALAFIRLENTKGPQLPRILASVIFARRSFVRFEQKPLPSDLSPPQMFGSPRVTTDSDSTKAAKAPSAA